jgi:hypothetical protein
MWTGRAAGAADESDQLASVDTKTFLDAGRKVGKVTIDRGKFPEMINANPVAVSGIRPCANYDAVLSLFSRDAVVQLASKLASALLLETWNVGLVRMNFRALLTGAPLSDVTLLPRLKLGHYVADPFILSTTPELTLLVEDYTDFGVGRISEMTVRDPFGTPEVGLKVRLESKHHMRRERRENCVGRPWLPRNPAEC